MRCIHTQLVPAGGRCELTEQSVSSAATRRSLEACSVAIALAYRNAVELIPAVTHSSFLLIWSVRSSSRRRFLSRDRRRAPSMLAFIATDSDESCPSHHAEVSSRG